jgi:hypothetical protein
VDRLPVEEKEELLRYLAMRLRKIRPAPQGRLFSPQEIADMLAEDEADGKDFCQSR